MVLVWGWGACGLECRLLFGLRFMTQGPGVSFSQVVLKLGLNSEP